MENEIKKHIEKLREDKNPTYQQDGIDMENILLNLESKNYEIAESIYSKMDTIVRDDFIEKMTNEYTDKEKMKYLSDKLGFEWIGDQKKFLETQTKELGKCPYCDSEEIERDLSELIEDYEKPYCIFECTCNKCKKEFSEYFAIDETKWDEGEDEDTQFITETLGNKDKETLIKALNLLVEKENDTNDYSEIFNKLKGELKPYN